MKFLLIAFLFTLSACQSPYPPAPKQINSPLQQAEYILGALDSIEIFVWRSPELSTSVSIRPDGKISTPLIEDLMAAGKTPTALAREIELILSTYVKDPLVTVIVKGFNGAYDQQIRVVGQSRTPSAIPYSAGMTVLDVIISVGGLMPFADGNSATLTRGSGPHKEIFSLQLDDLIRNGNINANVPVSPGDVIIIPEAAF